MPPDPITANPALPKTNTQMVSSIVKNATTFIAAGQNVRPAPLEIAITVNAKSSSGIIQMRIRRYCSTKDEISGDVEMKGSINSRSLSAPTAMIDSSNATTKALLSKEGSSDAKSPAPFKFAVMGIIALRRANSAMTVEISNVVANPKAANSSVEKLPATNIATVCIPISQA